LRYNAPGDVVAACGWRGGIGSGFDGSKGGVERRARADAQSVLPIPRLIQELKGSGAEIVIHGLSFPIEGGEAKRVFGDAGERDSAVQIIARVPPNAKAWARAEHAIQAQGEAEHEQGEGDGEGGH
jgi:hypothetical protein